MDTETAKALVATLSDLIANVGALTDRVERLEKQTAILFFQAYAHVADPGPWAWGVIGVDQFEALALRDPSVRRVGQVTTYVEARAIIEDLEARLLTGRG